MLARTRRILTAVAGQPGRLATITGAVTGCALGYGVILYGQSSGWGGTGPYTAPVIDSLGVIYSVPAAPCPDIGPVTVAAAQAAQRADQAVAGVTSVSTEVAMLKAQVQAMGASQAVLDRLAALESDPRPQNETVSLTKGQTRVIIPAVAGEKHVTTGMSLAQVAGAARVRLVVGGGADCAVGRAERSGYLPLTALASVSLPGTSALAGQAVCIQADGDITAAVTTSFYVR